MKSASIEMSLTLAINPDDRSKIIVVMSLNE